MVRRNILLIPGPLTTSYRVKNSLTIDYSAREPYFINIIKSVREKILTVSNTNPNKYTSILIQGSGSYGNESIISSLPNSSKVSVFSNGIYGDRLRDICHINNNLNNFNKLEYTQQITPEIVEKSIKDCDSTHVALVHNETTSGILNPIDEIIPILKKYKKKVIIDAISSYGGVPIDINKLNIDYLSGSSNKCLHGHPGLSFVIANKETLEECKEQSNTLSLDLYSQYKDFNKKEQFRFTPPVQIVNSLHEALDELLENSIDNRYAHYYKLNQIIYNELTDIGFTPYLDRKINSPIVSTYYIPEYIINFDFDIFSQNLKKYKIVLYPSPIDNQRLIRIGNIGDISVEEIYYCLNIMKIELLKLN